MRESSTAAGSLVWIPASAPQAVASPAVHAANESRVDVLNPQPLNLSKTHPCTRGQEVERVVPPIAVPHLADRPRIEEFLDFLRCEEGTLVWNLLERFNCLREILGELAEPHSPAEDDLQAREDLVHRH
jgi:hypothetical protein